jgi:hypothetical protein
MLVSLEDFNRDVTAKGGRKSYCKRCAKKQRKRYYSDPKNLEKICKKSNEWKKNNKERVKKNLRKWSLRNKFNMTVDEYDEMLEKQKGVCAICGKSEVVKNQYGIKRLAVDHNHITGKVRGLLCTHCNIGIGNLFVDFEGVNLLLNAINYVREMEDS